MKAFLHQIHSVEDDILEEYISHWQPYDLPKKSIMTAEGEVEKYFYYVIEGIQKSYYLEDGKQHVIAFTYSPSFTGVPDSFFGQQPSKVFLETITDSRFVRISYEKHQQLMAEYRPIETLFRKSSEMFLVGLLERYYELMSLDIEKRFRSFVSRSPHLLNMVSQKDMASYLKIDPTNFSKLMNKVRI